MYQTKILEHYIHKLVKYQWWLRWFKLQYLNTFTIRKAKVPIKASITFGTCDKCGFTGTISKIVAGLINWSIGITSANYIEQISITKSNIYWLLGYLDNWDIQRNLVDIYHIKDVLGIRFYTCHTYFHQCWVYKYKFHRHCNQVHWIRLHGIDMVDRLESRKSCLCNGHKSFLQCLLCNDIVQWSCRNQSQWNLWRYIHKLEVQKLRSANIFKMVGMKLPVQLGWNLNPSWHLSHCLPWTLALQSHCPSVLLQIKLVEPSRLHPQSAFKIRFRKFRSYYIFHFQTYSFLRSLEIHNENQCIRCILILELHICNDTGHWHRILWSRIHPDCNCNPLEYKNSRKNKGKIIVYTYGWAAGLGLGCWEHEESKDYRSVHLENE